MKRPHFSSSIFYFGVPARSVWLYAYLAPCKVSVRNSQNWAAKTHLTIASDSKPDQYTTNVGDR